MTVQNILDRAQVVEFETWTDTEPLLQEFDIHYSLDGLDGIIKSKHVFKWKDMYTYVGITLYYMGDSPLAIMWKPYRKSKPKIFWLNKLLKKAFQNYVMELYCNSSLRHTFLEKGDSLEEHLVDFELLEYNS